MNLKELLNKGMIEEIPYDKELISNSVKIAKKY